MQKKLSRSFEEKPNASGQVYRTLPYLLAQGGPRFPFWWGEAVFSG